MKCWKCNQEIGTGGCACDRIRCTLASWDVSTSPDNSKLDRIAELEDENAALRAEFDHAVRINNPCEHTGLESFVCDICGYPDPRKMIAALKADIEMGKKREDAMHERWKKATAKYPNGAEGCCCLFDKDGNQINWCSVHAELRAERDALLADNAKLREAVNEIAYIVNCKAYNMAHGPTISGICDKALRGGEAK